MMMSTLKRRRPLQDETGAMLVIALLIITVVAVVTGAILSHAWTNLHATISLRGVAGTSYAADAAAKVATDHLRLGADAVPRPVPDENEWDEWVYSNNIDGTGCFGVDGAGDSVNTLHLEQGIYPQTGDQDNSSSARVECTVVPGTGLFGTGGGTEANASNRFARALTTLGNSSGDGLNLDSNSDLQMRGGIRSATTVVVQHPATLTTDGCVRAATPPTGTIFSDQTACDNAALDPNLPDPISDVPDPGTYTSCSGGTRTFSPGYYNSAQVLTDLTDHCNLSHFSPGDYYFDFLDDDEEHVWEIKNVVIGGTLKVSDSQIPGRCVSPIDEDNSDSGSGRNGVRFIFGGDSRIELGNNAEVELCGTYSESLPPVVIHQLKNGPGTTETVAPPMAAATTTTTGDGTWAPTAASGLLDEALSAEGGTQASWTASGNNRSATLRLSSFAPTPVLPAGTSLGEALIRIKHQQTVTSGLVVKVTNGTKSKSYPVAANATLDWDVIDITADFAADVASGNFAPTIEVATNKAKDPTAVVDVVRIDLKFTKPEITAGELVDIVSAPGGGYAGSFVMQGAVYAPNGRVDIEVANHVFMAFRHGMVVWGANFKGSPQYVYGYPLVSIPDVGEGLGNRVTAVDLTVYVCVGTGPCETGGSHVLTLRVLITDPPWGDFGQPEPGQRKIEIVSWAEQN